jgi:hypothetical protein
VHGELQTIKEVIDSQNSINDNSNSIPMNNQINAQLESSIDRNQTGDMQASND